MDNENVNMEKEKDKKKKPKRRRLGIRDFFRGKSGRNFLLFIEGVMFVLFLLNPELYYNPNVLNFWDRFYADSISICGGLWAILVLLTYFPLKPSDKVNKILTWIALPGTPVLAFLWLELYNHMQFWDPFWQIPILYNLLNFALYVVIYVILLLIFNSVKYASISMIFLTAAAGTMNYEICTFRGMPFIASDIYSVGTALSVANTYQPTLDVDTAEFGLLALVLIALFIKLKRKPLFKLKGRILFLGATLAMLAVTYNVYVASDYLENVGVDFRVYRPQNKYRYYGTLLTTMRTFGYLHVTEPEDYSTTAVTDLISEFDQEAETDETVKDTLNNEKSKSLEKRLKESGMESPNIICIMNESFADLKEDGDIETSQDYMPFFRSLKTNTIKGYTYSSVFGGNTANSEFEFLTGNTLAFLPDNSVPYQLFLRSSVPGLTYTLKDQGYSNPLALHPYLETGYSRYKVYPLMGFNKFYTSEDFSLFTDTVNYHITDFEDYEKITTLYENSRQDASTADTPFYLFNVTMQNHGSYTGSTYETGDDVKIEGSMRGYMQAEEYLNMIKMSDDALKYLVQYFQKVDEPTVILFFGDHQPDLDDTFYNSLLNMDTGTLEGEDLEQLYKVPFLIWANYDIPEKEIERTSNNYLSTYLAQVTGIEMTDYQKYLLNLRQTIPAINAIGYWDNDGNYYDTDDTDSPYYDLIHDYNLLEYNNLFGGKNRQDSFFFLNTEGKDD